MTQVARAYSLRSFNMQRPALAANQRAPEIALTLEIASLWQVAVWTTRRARDGSDEPWGLLALAALLVVAALSRKHAARLTSRWAAVATLVYALCLHWLSPLPAAIVGLFALALSLSSYLYGRTLSFGTLGLCWLSVPLLASLDFYLGYPLRWITAEAATWFLHCSGCAVQRRGVSLIAGGAEIAVDPACSGIRMLWGTALLLSLLDCMRPLPMWIALKKAATVFALLLFANSWRVAALFYLESGRVEGPPWLHDVTGVAIFVVGVAIAVLVWQRAANRQPNSSRANLRNTLARQRVPALSLCAAASVALTASAFGAPLTTRKDPPGREVTWPREFEHTTLIPQAPPSEVARFHRQFPGKIGFFHTKTQQLIFRYVNEPTRKLHPAEHCYRANGYTVESSRQCVRADGKRYGCFTATRGDRRVRVSERLYDDRGNEFTDVSSWYWAAVFGRTHGPWHAVTIAERAPSPDASADTLP